MEALAQKTWQQGGKVAPLRNRKNFRVVGAGGAWWGWQEGLAEKGDHGKSRHVLSGPMKELGCIRRSGKPLRRWSRLNHQA